jgi:hypothetical protein
VILGDLHDLKSHATKVQPFPLDGILEPAAPGNLDNELWIPTSPTSIDGFVVILLAKFHGFNESMQSRKVSAPMQTKRYPSTRVKERMGNVSIFWRQIEINRYNVTSLYSSWSTIILVVSSVHGRGAV